MDRGGQDFADGSDAQEAILQDSGIELELVAGKQDDRCVEGKSATV